MHRKPPVRAGLPPGTLHGMANAPPPRDGPGKPGKPRADKLSSEGMSPAEMAAAPKPPVYPPGWRPPHERG